MLKRTVLFILVFCLVSPAAICIGDDGHHDEGHICFTRIDTDQDDVASFEEFSIVFGDDQKMYKEMDLDGDGKLTHEEYEEYYYSKEG